MLNSSNYLSKIILADLYLSGLTARRIFVLDRLKSELTNESLMDERWLFAYEIIKKNWVTPQDDDFITSNEYFNLLLKNDVEFYN